MPRMTTEPTTVATPAPGEHAAGPPEPRMDQLATEGHSSESLRVHLAVNGIATPGSLGSWLCAKRLARKWTKAEMARRLYRAAKASGDNSVSSAAILTSYVRRWERGDLMPTERYRLLYCTVLEITPDQFGQGHLSLPAACNGNIPHDQAGVHIDKVESVVVQIPAGCQQIVINLPCVKCERVTKGCASCP